MLIFYGNYLVKASTVSGMYLTASKMGVQSRTLQGVRHSALIVHEFRLINNIRTVFNFYPL